MRIFLVEIGLVVGSVLLTAMVSAACWRHGVACPVGWLASIFTNGGEAAYDAGDIETFLLSFLFLHVLYWGVQMWRRKRVKGAGA